MKRFLQIGFIVNVVLGCLQFSAHAKEIAHTSTHHTELCVLLIALIVSLCIIAVLCVDFSKRLKTRVSMIDHETGVGNYRYFTDKFESLSGGYTNSIYYIAYIIIDSNFIQFHKGEANFNDIVSNTACVLTNVSRTGDVVARITESGFAYMFEDTDPESAKSHVESIIDKLNHYTDIDDYSARRCFYAALYNLCHTDSNAELLLYNLRRNCNLIVGSDKQFVFCDSESMNSVQEEQKMLERIDRGFKNGEFKMFVQFGVDNKTKQIVTAEALSRWEDPDIGLIPPLKYIKVMEHTGTISMLDYHMFERVCALLDKWFGTDKGNISVSCNVTRITLSDREFVNKIKEISDRFTFDRKNLILEITEDAMEKDKQVALGNVIACKKMGFTIALDDMGSGYTSLKNLCDYPIDIVKIDRDILLKSENERGQKLIQGMIAFSHSLNLSVVCEGVETVAHDKFISATECDVIQGWYYSGVMPMRECDEFIAEYVKKLVTAEN